MMERKRRSDESVYSNVNRGMTARKLDLQGDRIREGFKRRVPGKSGVGPL